MRKTQHLRKTSLKFRGQSVWAVPSFLVQIQLCIMPTIHGYLYHQTNVIHIIIHIFILWCKLFKPEKFATSSNLLLCGVSDRRFLTHQKVIFGTTIAFVNLFFYDKNVSPTNDHLFKEENLWLKKILFFDEIKPPPNYFSPPLSLSPQNTISVCHLILCPYFWLRTWPQSLVHELQGTLNQVDLSLVRVIHTLFSF